VARLTPARRAMSFSVKGGLMSWSVMAPELSRGHEVRNSF
jgi:hypothetical protein